MSMTVIHITLGCRCSLRGVACRLMPVLQATPTRLDWVTAQVSALDHASDWVRPTPKGIVPVRQERLMLSSGLLTRCNQSASHGASAKQSCCDSKLRSSYHVYV
jgi:hypothetical protein